MGYYHCTNCDDVFSYPYRKNPKYCKTCGSPYHLNKIEHCQYVEWLQMRKDAEWYNEVFGDIIWNECKRVWDAYDSKNNS